MELGVSDVAERLGVSANRVRSLINAGELPARRVVGRWVVDEDAVAAGQIRQSGRPMSPRVAWGLISLVENGRALELDPAERSRLRRRLRADPKLEQVVVQARRRNVVHRLRVHPAALPRARNWPGAVASGASARGHDVIDLGVVEIYLSADEVESLVRKLHAWPADRDANLIVRVPAVRQWPFKGEVAGPVAVALDLWESGEPRSQRVAQQMWSRELAAGRFEARR